MIKFNKTVKKDDKKEQFEKIKKFVQKQYPEASTKVDIFGQYYVQSKDGKRILPDDPSFNNTKTVFEAWKNTYEYLKSIHKIKLNDKRFNGVKNKESVLSNILMQK